MFPVVSARLLLGCTRFELPIVWRSEQQKTAHARALPFASTVEDDTALPGWPHVHIEVVDRSVKDRPTGPGC